MDDMFNESTRTFCHNYNYRNPQYGWGHTNDWILFQTALNLVEHMLRRNGSINAPYPGNWMNMGNQEHLPYFPRRSRRSLGGTALQGVGSSSEYDVFAPSHEGYASAPQVDGDIRHAEQHMKPIEPSFVPTVPGPVLSIPAFEHLAQGTYRGKVSVKGTPAGPVYFNDSEGQGPSVSLASLAALANGNAPAFDAATDIGRKASIRFKLLHFSEPSGQILVRHGDQGRGGRPITLREMGHTMFDVLRKLMDHAERCGCPLRHGGSVVDIERVVLLRVDHVSKSSIQPILGIRNNG
ncbi:hypothetical protein V8D89_002618 [Ganoderma adspersum]